MNHKIFVYGTLRPGLAETVLIPGHLFNLNWFPGCRLSEEGTTLVGQTADNPVFVAEPVVVDDAALKRLDQYEGYRADSPGTSLFIRRPYLDGWIYEFNGDTFGAPIIEGGDWLAYMGTKEGSNASLLTRG